MVHEDCCLKALWKSCKETAFSIPGAEVQIDLQRKRDPHDITPQMFFRQAAWTIYISGIKESLIANKWPPLEEIFLNWNYQEVYLSKMAVRTRAMGIINNLHKAEAVNYVAEWIYRVGWENIKKYLLYNLTIDANGNFIPDPGLIPYLDFLPMIGETNALSILSSLGYDVATPDSKFKALSARFGYSPDFQGAQRFASNLSSASGERISVVELILRLAYRAGVWDRFTCPVCGNIY